MNEKYILPSFNMELDRCLVSQFLYLYCFFLGRLKVGMGTGSVIDLGLWASPFCRHRLPQPESHEMPRSESFYSNKQLLKSNESQRLDTKDVEF